MVISRNIISKKRSKKASFISEDVEEDTLSEEEEKNFAPAAKKPKRTSPPQALSDQTVQLIKAKRTQSGDSTRFRNILALLAPKSAVCTVCLESG